MKKRRRGKRKKICESVAWKEFQGRRKKEELFNFLFGVYAKSHFEPSNWSKHVREKEHKHNGSAICSSVDSSSKESSMNIHKAHPVMVVSYYLIFFPFTSTISGPEINEVHGICLVCLPFTGASVYNCNIVQMCKIYVDASHRLHSQMHTVHLNAEFHFSSIFQHGMAFYPTNMDISGWCAHAEMNRWYLKNALRSTFE